MRRRFVRSARPVQRHPKRRFQHRVVAAGQDGDAPALIEWRTDARPAARLEDRGLSLARLEILHPDPARLARLLSSLELDAPVAVRPAPAGENPRLVAHIDTPWGLRLLSAP